MAEPNFAAVAEMLAFYADTRDELKKHTETASTGLVATFEAMRNDIEGDHAQSLRDNLEIDRENIAALLGRENIRAGFVPIVQQIAEAIDSPDSTNIEQVWEDLYDYCVTNAEDVNAKQLAFAAWGTGSPTGSGELGIWLTTDEDGFPMEGFFADTYRLECVRDARATGAAHQEFFRLTGTNKAPDELSRTGTGFDLTVKSLNARDSAPYLLNASFNSGAPAPTTGSPTTPTSLPGWTDVTGSYTNVRLEFDLAYRSTPGDANSWSLEFVANTHIWQDLVADNNARIDFDVPYLIGPAMYREGTADGTATLRLTTSATPTSGGVSRAITVSGQTNATWLRYWIIASPGANNWPANFNVNSLVLSLQWAGRSQGSIFWDDIIFSPFTRVGTDNDPRRGRGSMGVHVAVVGGVTPWVKGDFKTSAVTSGTGVNQYNFALASLGYLPAQTDGSETISDK